MENRCVCCGVIIPEGRQVCITCEKKAVENCKTCVNAILDEVFGEYKCKLRQTRIYDINKSYIHCKYYKKQQEEK